MEKQKTNWLIILGFAFSMIWLFRRQIFAKYKSYLGQNSLPRGLRNNNPGNLKYVASNDWMGKVPLAQNTDKTFEQFKEFRYGVAALLKLLRKYIQTGRATTIRGIITLYAPATENNTSTYIQTVAARLGTSPDSPLQANETTLKALAKVIARVEVGRELSDTELTHGYHLI
ncbi:hypothetical protein QNI19_16445 [Cytophagaceae bacterium DM2B3-1]|uniref:Uncharacterized protein n=1 Tax=Xanthocytophaga flava TaxID=3048013 RepID=A0ABT7CLD0_9BACT|nr:hypothetical protein [Xanthocytophaga flavus]MDJ1494536.1 hypothetical protein [Xanthocytophaga flavus]